MPPKKKPNKKLQAIEASVEAVNDRFQILQNWALTALVLAVFVVLVCLVIFRFQEKIYEHKLRKQYEAFVSEVVDLTSQQTKAVSDLNELIKLLRPIIAHKELQMIDYYRNEIWKWEEDQKKLYKQMKEEQRGPTKPHDTGHSKPDQRQVGGSTNSSKEKKR